MQADEYLRMLSVNLEQNRAIINSVHDGVIAADENGRIYQINDSAVALLGGKAQDYTDKPLEKIFSVKLMERIRKEKNFTEAEERISVGNTKVAVLVTAQTIEWNGMPYGTVLTIKTMKELSALARRVIRDDDYKISFDDIIGDSVEIENAKDFARRVAGSNSTVLIRGESGTGKEMFARAIHGASSRSNGPFVAINSAAIPEQLLESELFGYEDGAFTGARHGGKMGKCELAIGGTLFLDEVGDIPLFLQSKFLRMLQERCIERVGGNKRIPVDIRIIAATNRNLEEMIVKKEFREDLYYRLNVIPVFLPPLRKRKEDVFTVSEYFLKKYTERLGKEIEFISPDAKRVLGAYNWPGNLRELENAIECAVNIETSGVLTVTSLPEKIRESVYGMMNQSQSAADTGAGGFAQQTYTMPAGAVYGSFQDQSEMKDEAVWLRERRRKADLETVLKALDKYGWDTKGKKNAAKSLGIGIATLYLSLIHI